MNMVISLILVSLTVCTVVGDTNCFKKEISSGSILCVCNSTYCDTITAPEVLPEGHYTLYSSTKDGLRFSQSSGRFGSESSGADYNFKIDNTIKYQKIFGFGGAFTDAFGINIKSLPEGAQEKLLRSYFSPEGLEYNFGRVPIGGCDFSTEVYTLDDVAGDINLTQFNLKNWDTDYKIPIIKEAMAMSRRPIKLLGSAWTAPPWMKTNGAYTGFGFLKSEYYQLWATYHLKFLEAYKDKGLDFWGITSGNEPFDAFVPIFVKFNSMGWLPSTQAKWVAENLGPTIRESKFKAIRIVLFDDQRLLIPKWIKSVMSNMKAAAYIDGFATHWYWDEYLPVSLVTKTHDLFPSKFIISSEASQGDKPWETNVIPGSWERGQKYIDNIIENIDHWMSGWIDWNLALNMEGGPNWAKNFVDAAILVDSTKGEFYKQPMYYAIGHFSKFIKPDAFRIDIQPQTGKGINVLSVENVDKSIVVVLHNKNKGNVTVKLQDTTRGSAIVTLPANSFNTIIYW